MQANSRQMMDHALIVTQAVMVVLVNQLTIVLAVHGTTLTLSH
jgi:hypothetical protein